MDKLDSNELKRIEEQAQQAAMDPKKYVAAKVSNYVDMGHFRDPKTAEPYLVDGYWLGMRSICRPDALAEITRMARAYLELRTEAEWYCNENGYNHPKLIHEKAGDPIVRAVARANKILDGGEQ